MREFLKYIPFEDIKAKGSSSALLVGSNDAIPLISLIGVIQGEILECLEAKGRLALRQILKHLHRPTHLVAMALGVLIYSGLVRAMQGEKFISVWLAAHK